MSLQIVLLVLLPYGLAVGGFWSEEPPKQASPPRASDPVFKPMRYVYLLESLAAFGISEHEEISYERIKSAFRPLAKTYHPDRTGGDEKAAAKFQDLTNMRDALLADVCHGL
jgi:hypothetical protein